MTAIATAIAIAAKSTTTITASAAALLEPTMSRFSGQRSQPRSAGSRNSHSTEGSTTAVTYAAATTSWCAFGSTRPSGKAMNRCAATASASPSVAIESVNPGAPTTLKRTGANVAKPTAIISAPTRLPGRSQSPIRPAPSQATPVATLAAMSAVVCVHG